MEQLINRNNQAIIKRGLITKDTTLDDYFDKLDEEVKEAKEAYNDDNLAEELSDIKSVCDNILLAMKRNPIIEYEKVVLKNEKRANDG